MRVAAEERPVMREGPTYLSPMSVLKDTNNLIEKRGGRKDSTDLNLLWLMMCTPTFLNLLLRYSYIHVWVW